VGDWHGSTEREGKAPTRRWIGGRGRGFSVSGRRRNKALTLPAARVRLVSVTNQDVKRMGKRSTTSDLMGPHWSQKYP